MESSTGVADDAGYYVIYETSASNEETLINATDTVVSTDQARDDHPKSLAQNLWIFASPIIFFVGLTGNILIIVLMSRPRLKGTTTSIYLRLIAIADSCVLITGVIPEWLEASEVVLFKNISPVTCKLEKFSFYTSGDTAIWLLVLFTIDRFFAVVFPIERKTCCLPSKMPLVAIMTLLLAICKNFHVFWTRGAEYKQVGNDTVLVSNCGRPTKEIQHFEFFVRPWIAFTTVSAIPFVVILVCNVFIIRALVDVRDMRTHQSSHAATSDRAFVQMTIMCLSVSFCFLICITPSIALLIGRPYWQGTKSNPNTGYDTAKAINNQLVYVNHGINFFLYCMTGRRFRIELWRTLSCGRYEPRYGYGDSRTSVYRLTVNQPHRLKLRSTARPTAKNGLLKYTIVQGFKANNYVSNL